MLILTDGVKIIYGKKVVIGTGLNLEESADGLPILHFGESTGTGTQLGNSVATSVLNITLNAQGGAQLTLPSLPIGFTIWEIGQFAKADLRAFRKARVVSEVVLAGDPGTRVVVRYSADLITWLPLGSDDDVGAALDGVGMATGEWTTLADTARDDVYLAWGTLV